MMIFFIFGIIFIAVSNGFVKVVEQYCDKSLDISKWSEQQK